MGAAAATATTGGQAGAVSIGAPPTPGHLPPPLSIARAHPPAVVAEEEEVMREGIHNLTPWPRPSHLRPVTCSEEAACTGVEVEGMQAAMVEMAPCIVATPSRTLDSDPPTSRTFPPSPPTPNAAAAQTPSSAPTSLADHTSAPSPPTAPTWPPQPPSTLTSAPPYRRPAQTGRRTSTRGDRSATSPCPRDQTPLICPAPSPTQAPWDARPTDPIPLAPSPTHPCPPWGEAPTHQGRPPNST